MNEPNQVGTRIDCLDRTDVIDLTELPQEQWIRLDRRKRSGCETGDAFQLLVVRR